MMTKKIKLKLLEYQLWGGRGKGILAPMERTSQTPGVMKEKTILMIFVFENHL